MEEDEDSEEEESEDEDGEALSTALDLKVIFLNVPSLMYPNTLSFEDNKYD